MFNWPKRIFNAIFNRLTITAAVIVAQAVYFIFLLVDFSDMSHYVTTTFQILSVILLLYIIWRDNNPAYQIGWIILICVFPVIGCVLFLLFGNKRPARYLKRRLDRQEDMHVEEMHQTAPIQEIRNQRLQRTASYVGKQCHYPAWQHSTTKYYPVADRMFEDMLEDLKNAEHFIFLEYFIIARGSLWDDIFEILRDKAAQGVDIRIIYDDVGSMRVLPKHFVRNMKENGIRVMAFNRMRPFLSLVYNNRDHRKIMVIDGYIAYNGGANIADEYANRIVRFGHWKDGGVRVFGEACWNYTVMFLNMWNAFEKEHPDEDYSQFHPHTWHEDEFPSDGTVQPYSDTPLDDEDVGESVYLEIINQAQDYVFIYTPYLIVDEDMETALKLAAKRGVDVRLVTPGIPDKWFIYQITRSNYDALLRAGVRIFEYTPGFIHAKNFVSDDRVGVIGTINIDFRSLFLHFECGTLLYGTDSLVDLRNDAIDTFRRSHEITLQDGRQSFIGRLIGMILKVLSPLL